MFFFPGFGAIACMISLFFGVQCSSPQPATHVPTHATALRPVAAPLLNPGSGASFTDSIAVSMTAPPGAEIRYTLDGAPVSQYSRLYTAPVILSTSTRLSARAFKAGWAPSSVASANYVQKAASPTFSPGSTSLNGGSLGVKITTATSGAIIRYTMNGGDPTTASRTYRGPIVVSRTTRISARAYKSRLAASDVSRATYINPVSSLSPRAGVFFDDFKYSSAVGNDTRFTDRWQLADGCGDGPGVGPSSCGLGADGTTQVPRYSADLVTVVPDEPSGILQIKTITSGTADTTLNALVTTLERQPIHGTFATKIWFDNSTGQRDVNEQAFLLSYGGDPRVNPSEISVEYFATVDADSLAVAQTYRADGGLCVASLPCLFMTSWRPNVNPTDRTVSSAAASLLGWHYIVIQVDRDKRQVRYGVYDAMLRPIARATHRDPFFPAEQMFLMLNHSLPSFDVVSQRPGETSREYKMWVDWVYRDPDASLTILDIEREVAALQRDGCARFPDPDPRVPCH